MNSQTEKIVQEIEASLSPKLRTWVGSLFIDTRLTQDVLVQSLREPAGFQTALLVFEKYHGVLGKVARDQFPAKYETALALEATEDNIERMAIWSTLLAP